MEARTMSPEHSMLESHLKKTTKVTAFIASLISIVASFFFAVGAYYRLKGSDEQQNQKIFQTEAKVTVIENKLTETAVSQGVSTTEIKTLQRDVSELKESVGKMNDKLDRILIQTRQ